MALAKRSVRFVISGCLSTAVAYLATMFLLSVTNYAVATALAWILSVAVGFVVNRRFTFEIVGPEKRTRDLSFFLVGSAIQLAITISGYYVMMGHFHIAYTVAFLVNLTLTTSFSFAFLNLVAFKR